MRLLVTGGGGFVGSAVRAVLAGRADVRVRWAVREPGRFGPVPARDEVCRLDLADLGDLPAAVRGVDAVLHLAHLVSGADADLALVNTAGTAALVRACAAAEVSRLVRLSTAAVYGPGPWPHTADLVPAPASRTSATRLAGDELVLAAGGTVVRPHLVHGPGDRWFLPRALSVTRRVGFVEDGRARHSVIPVADLAAELVRRSLDDPAPGTVFPPHGEPVVLRALLTAAFLARSDRPPAAGVTLAAALRSAAGRDDPRWRHDLHLLAHDHVVPPPRR